MVINECTWRKVFEVLEAGDSHEGREADPDDREGRSISNMGKRQRDAFAEINDEKRS